MITQGPITIFCSGTIFFPEQLFCITRQLKNYSKTKKLFWNKFDWITHVGWFVRPVYTLNIKFSLYPKHKIWSGGGLV
jgi:hypothetical protein